MVSSEIYACVGTLWCGPAQLWQLVPYEDREAAGDPRNLIARVTVKDTSRIRVIEEASAITKGAERRTTRANRTRGSRSSTTATTRAGERA